MCKADSALNTDPAALSVAPSDTDTRLLEFLAAEYRRLDDAVEQFRVDRPNNDYDDATWGLVSRQCRIEDLLAATPASTMAGVIAKASLAELCSCSAGGIEGDLAQAIRENDGSVARLAISLTRDLFRLLEKEGQI